MHRLLRCGPFSRCNNGGDKGGVLDPTQPARFTRENSTASPRSMRSISVPEPFLAAQRLGGGRRDDDDGGGGSIASGRPRADGVYRVTIRAVSSDDGEPDPEKDGNEKEDTERAEDHQGSTSRNFDRDDNAAFREFSSVTAGIADDNRRNKDRRRRLASVDRSKGTIGKAKGFKVLAVLHECRDEEDAAGAPADAPTRITQGGPGRLHYRKRQPLGEKVQPEEGEEPHQYSGDEIAAGNRGEAETPNSVPDCSPPPILSEENIRVFSQFRNPFEDADEAETSDDSFSSNDGSEPDESEGWNRSPLPYKGSPRRLGSDIKVPDIEAAIVNLAVLDRWCFLNGTGVGGEGIAVA